MSSCHKNCFISNFFHQKRREKNVQKTDLEKCILISNPTFFYKSNLTNDCSSWRIIVPPFLPLFSAIDRDREKGPYLTLPTMKAPLIGGGGTKETYVRPLNPMIPWHLAATLDLFSFPPHIFYVILIPQSF